MSTDARSPAKMGNVSLVCSNLLHDDGRAGVDFQSELHDDPYSNAGGLDPCISAWRDSVDSI